MFSVPLDINSLPNLEEKVVYVGEFFNKNKYTLCICCFVFIMRVGILETI